MADIPLILIHVQLQVIALEPYSWNLVDVQAQTDFL
jgi:hypothetical protein